MFSSDREIVDELKGCDNSEELADKHKQIILVKKIT